MRIKSLLISALAYCASASAAVDYIATDFTGGVPEGYQAFDVDGAKLHFLMKQVGFEQGDSWKAFSAAGEACLGSPSMSSDKVDANDWFVTPLFLVRGADAQLTFRVQSFNEQGYTKCSYKVMVAEEAECTPTNEAAVELLPVAEAPVNEWGYITADLGQYVGKRISLAFVNVSTAKCEILCMDNLLVAGAPGSATVEYLPGQYVLSSEPFKPGVKVTATDSDPITSVELACTVNGKSYTASATGISVVKGQSVTVQLAETLPLALGEEVTYDMSVSINGLGYDPVHMTTRALSFIPRRKVVLEEQTGTWCGWCPKAIVAADSLKMKYGDQIIPIAIHVIADPMAYDEYAQALTPYGAVYGGAPSGLFDRTFFTTEPLPVVKVGRDERYTMRKGFGTMMEQALAVPTLGEVNLTAVRTGLNGVTLKSSARFAMDLKGVDYRIAYVITESGVTGSEADGYVQHNYLCDYPARGPVGGFESMDSEIVGMQFHHVARAVVNNKYTGIEGIIPANVEGGKEYSYNVSFQLPSPLKPDNCAIVAMIIDNKTGKVINAAEHSFYQHSAIEEVTGAADAVPVAYYDLAGRRHSAPVPGVNIVIYSDGTSAKLLR